MFAFVATLAAAFAVMIGLKHLADLILTRSIYQAAYSHEPVIIGSGTGIFSPISHKRQRVDGRADRPRAIAFNHATLAPDTSPAFAPEDDALSLPQA